MVFPYFFIDFFNKVISNQMAGHFTVHHECQSFVNQFKPFYHYSITANVSTIYRTYFTMNLFWLNLFGHKKSDNCTDFSVCGRPDYHNLFNYYFGTDEMVEWPSQHNCQMRTECSYAAPPRSFLNLKPFYKMAKHSSKTCFLNDPYNSKTSSYCSYNVNLMCL